MIRLIAPGGEHAGKPIWSCATYPKCRGTLAVADDPQGPITEPVSASAGRATPPLLRAGWIRQSWPIAIGLVLVALLVAYLLTRAVLGPA